MEDAISSSFTGKKQSWKRDLMVSFKTRRRRKEMEKSRMKLLLFFFFFRILPPSSQSTWGRQRLWRRDACIQSQNFGKNKNLKIAHLKKIFLFLHIFPILRNQNVLVLFRLWEVIFFSQLLRPWTPRVRWPLQLRLGPSPPPTFSPYFVDE